MYSHSEEFADSVEFLIVILLLKNTVTWAGEMAQRLRALTALPEVLSSIPSSPEFKSQQPHGGSQPSVMGSDALYGV